jgi:hypothetical protein
MTRLTRLLPAALLAFAPADVARGDAADGWVAEIVTFRLLTATSEGAFLNAARATGPLLAAAPGFVSRRLSRGPDGTWTDHVEWTSLAHAEAAADAIMKDPAAGPFLAAIDPATIVMRHEALLWTYGGD